MLILFCTLSYFVEVNAKNIKLPTEYYEKLSQSHENIFKYDFLICGNAQIGTKNTFLSNFFQGSPARGFLITPPFTNDDIGKIIRSEKDNAKLGRILIDKFSHMALISIDENFEHISIIKNPKVEIDIPKALHECLVDQRKRWGCGITESRNDECCEKKLGSPSIKAKWTDKTNGETYTLIYRLEIGNSFLQRTQKEKKTTYFCINSESFSIIK